MSLPQELLHWKNVLQNFWRSTYKKIRKYEYLIKKKDEHNYKIVKKKDEQIKRLLKIIQINLNDKKLLLN